MLRQKITLFLTLICINSHVMASNKSITIELKPTDSSSSGSFGTVTFLESPYGILITPKLDRLPQGIHGFHIHTNPSCDHAGMSAGSHYDPQNTGKHLGPYGQGHLGDLPVLIVSNEGKATLPLLAPRLKLKDLREHALMIHAGGDNYSDQPDKLGGGGARLACGVIR